MVKSPVEVLRLLAARVRMFYCPPNSSDVECNGSRIYWRTMRRLECHGLVRARRGTNYFIGVGLFAAPIFITSKGRRMLDAHFERSKIDDIAA